MFIFIFSFIVCIVWTLKKIGRLELMFDRIPGIGKHRQIYELSRLYLTLGMLLEGGIPITQAMHTASTILRPEMQVKLEQAKCAIESGIQFSTAFQTFDLVTPFQYECFVSESDQGSWINVKSVRSILR
jgi:general secretion pathway protein F